MSSTGKELRFTGKERKKVIRLNDFTSKILNFRKRKIESKSIRDIELPLADVSGKSCNLENFKKYIRVKNDVNIALGERYNQGIFRKLRWYGYINRERYYSNVIKKLKAMMTEEKNGTNLWRLWW